MVTFVPTSAPPSEKLIFPRMKFSLKIQCGNPLSNRDYTTVLIFAHVWKVLEKNIAFVDPATLEDRNQ